MIPEREEEIAYSGLTGQADLLRPWRGDLPGARRAVPAPDRATAIAGCTSLCQAVATALRCVRVRCARGVAVAADAAPAAGREAG